MYMHIVHLYSHNNYINCEFNIIMPQNVQIAKAWMFCNRCRKWCSAWDTSKWVTTVPHTCSTVYLASSTQNSEFHAVINYHKVFKCFVAWIKMAVVAVRSGLHLQGKSEGITREESNIPQTRATARRHAFVKPSGSGIPLGYGPLTKRKLMLPSVKDSSRGRLVQRTTWPLWQQSFYSVYFSIACILSYLHTYVRTYSWLFISRSVYPLVSS